MPVVWRRLYGWIALVVLLACGLTAFFHCRLKPNVPPVATPPSLAELLVMTPQQRADVDIALMNLRCAEGLHGSETLDIPATLQMLDRYAARVDKETTRHLYKYRDDPSEYQNSEPYFRMLMMAVVLQEDFKVHYNPERETLPGVFDPNDTFFAYSKDVFVHGLTSQDSMGTCSSVPVLFVAVGRRLDYPLYLVTSKNHLFVRWEDSRTSLNVEATARGLITEKDEYYKSWPCKISEEEIKDNSYLKSMTPSEELACFMSIRGHCLMTTRHYAEAVAAHREAFRLAPHIHGYEFDLGVAEREAKAKILALRMRQIDQVNALLDPETQNARQHAPAGDQN